MDEELTVSETEDAEPNGFVDDYDEAAAEVAEPVAEEAPAPEPTPDLEARLKELEKKEKALQKGFQEIAAREKRLTAAPSVAPAADDDPLANLDPEAQKILDAFVERKLGAYNQAVGSLLNDTMESELESYAKSKDVDPADIMEVITERNLQPRGFTRKDRMDVYDLAAAVVKANRDDDIESRIQAEVEKRIASLAEQGQVAGAPRPARVDVGEDEVVNPDDFDNPADRIAWYKRKGLLK